MKIEIWVPNTCKRAWPNTLKCSIFTLTFGSSSLFENFTKLYDYSVYFYYCIKLNKTIMIMNYDDLSLEDEGYPKSK